VRAEVALAVQFESSWLKVLVVPVVSYEIDVLSMAGGSRVVAMDCGGGWFDWGKQWHFNDSSCDDSNS